MRKHVISLDLFNDSTATSNMATTCVSREIDVRNLDNASLHLKWVAGPVGELQVQAQNNDSDPWFNLNAGSAWAISGSDSEAQILLAQLPFTKIRLKYLATSGSGTLSGYLTAKTEGA